MEAGGWMAVEGFPDVSQTRGLWSGELLLYPGDSPQDDHRQFTCLGGPGGSCTSSLFFGMHNLLKLIVIIFACEDDDY